MKSIQYETQTIRIGQTRRENWDLLEQSKGTDMLFHLSSFPSCYVVLETDGGCSQKTIVYCARLCTQYTKYKHLKNVYVDYTLCKNVKKGECVGEIVYKSKVNRIKV